MIDSQAIRSAALTACLALTLLPAAPRAQVLLQGTGAAFPFPLYATWLAQFSLDPEVREDYNSTGARVDFQVASSADGLAALAEGTMDFAATDVPVTDEQLADIERGLVPLPMTAGSIAIVYHLPGLDGLRLPRKVYPKIFAGEIEQWNDPAIAEANPDATLPELPITVIVRADASRANAVLTAHLSAIDEAFRESVGSSRAPKWPEQEQLASAGMNDGVAALLARTEGAIGYLDQGYAELADWRQLALLENRAGEYVASSVEAAAAALADAEFPQAELPSGAPDLRAETPDPSHAAAYPIVAMTWLVFYASGYDAAQLAAVRDLIAYFGSEAAQNQAAGLGYVPLPQPIIEFVQQAAETIQ